MKYIHDSSDNSKMPAEEAERGLEVGAYPRRLGRILLRSVGALKSFALPQPLPIGTHGARQLLA